MSSLQTRNGRKYFKSSPESGSFVGGVKRDGFYTELRPLKKVCPSDGPGLSESVAFPAKGAPGLTQSSAMQVVNKSPPEFHMKRESESSNEGFPIGPSPDQSPESSGVSQAAAPAAFTASAIHQAPPDSYPLPSAEQQPVHQQPVEEQYFFDAMPQSQMFTRRTFDEGNDDFKFTLDFTQAGSGDSQDAQSPAPASSTSTSEIAAYSEVDEAEVEEPTIADKAPSSVNCHGSFFSSSGKRPYQEDRYVVSDRNAYYAVYDGHGGSEASEYCKVHLENYVIGFLSSTSTDSEDSVKKAFRDAFVATDKRFRRELQQMSDKEVGTTVCVAHITDARKLYVANAGDTRAIVVCDDGSVVAMSFDQKPDMPEEKARVEKSGHMITITNAVANGRPVRVARVDGSLAVARSIGDAAFKDTYLKPEEWAVTCCPVVRSLQLEEKHAFLLIACDGIWDVFSNAEVARLVHSELGRKPKPISSDDLTRVCQFIVKSSIDKKSQDNCTVVLVDLSQQ